MDETATIIELAEERFTLRNRDKYVSQVFGNIHNLSRITGDTLQVRIGITGKGRSPNYRIEPEGTLWDSGLSYDWTVLGEFGRMARERHGLPTRPYTTHNPGQVLAMFDGKTHEPFQGKENEWELEAMLREEHWSRRAESYDEVRELLGRIRSFKPKTL